MDIICLCKLRTSLRVHALFLNSDISTSVPVEFPKKTSGVRSLIVIGASSRKGFLINSAQSISTTHSSSFFARVVTLIFSPSL